MQMPEELLSALFVFALFGVIGAGSVFRGRGAKIVRGICYAMMLGSALRMNFWDEITNAVAVAFDWLGKAVLAVVAAVVIWKLVQHFFFGKRIR